MTKKIKPAAVKFDREKPRTDLLPVLPLIETAKVFGYGAKKYDDFNYLTGKGLKYSQLYGAALRHMFAWYAGEDLDESGFNHIYHAICELMMIAHMIEEKKGIDNRRR